MSRPAVADDVPRLAALMAASPLLHRYRTTYEGALASLDNALAAGDLILVAEEPLQGFAWLLFAPRVLNGAAYLRLLLVAEGARGHGLGSRLLDAAEASAVERVQHVYLLTTTDNSGARRFYERHGYRHVGDLPGLVWPDLDEALYHKRLSTSA
jgi:ribosomal protein S18 acetylase RimI-like enzyme